MDRVNLIRDNMYIFIYIYIDVCKYIYMCVCKYIYVCMHTDGIDENMDIYIRMHMGTYTFFYTYIGCIHMLYST